MKRRYFQVALIVGLSGSGASITIPIASAAVPDWINKPPADTEDHFYGVGEGGDLVAARRAALREVAAKIKVTVYGSANSVSQMQGGVFSESARNVLHEEVQKTDFKQYQVIQSSVISERAYVLVQVDRKDFYRDLRDRIAKGVERVRHAVGGWAQKGDLERYIILNGLRPDLAQVQALYQVLRIGELSSQDLANKQEIDDWSNRLENFPSKLSFFIGGKREDADVVTVFANFITRCGMRTVATANGATGVVDIGVRQKADTVSIDRLVQLTISVTVQDGRKIRTLAGREYVIGGASLADHSAARTNAVRNFQKSLEGQTFFDVFGFKPVGV